MMYKCEDCGAVFQEPAYETEIHHEIDAPNIEEYPVCPNCGSENYVELEECEVCGELVEFTYFCGDEVIVCKDCMKLVDSIISNHLNVMETEFRSVHKASGINVRNMLISRMIEAY